MKKTIIAAALLLFILTGCLPSPYSPTARLIRKDAWQGSVGFVHSQYDYEAEYTQYDWLYGDVTQTADSSTMYNSLVLEARGNFGLDGVEFGLGYDGDYLTGDLKIALLPKDFYLLSAVDIVVQGNLYGSTALGAGLIVNFPVTKTIDFVMAGYYKYMLSGNSNYFFSYNNNNNRNTINGGVSHGYVGVDWALNENFGMAFGGGAEYYSDYRLKMPYNNYISLKGSIPVYGAISIKYTILPSSYYVEKAKEERKLEQSGIAADVSKGIPDYLSEAREEIRNKNYGNADKILREAMEAYPDNYLLIREMGNVQYSLRNEEDAIKYYEQALSIKPDDKSLKDFLKSIKK